jgi:hypothetical protein
VSSIKTSKSNDTDGTCVNADGIITVAACALYAAERSGVLCAKSPAEMTFDPPHAEEPPDAWRAISAEALRKAKKRAARRQQRITAKTIEALKGLEAKASSKGFHTKAKIIEVAVMALSESWNEEGETK